MASLIDSLSNSFDYYKSQIEDFVREITSLKENILSLKHRVGHLESENNDLRIKIAEIENKICQINKINKISEISINDGKVE